MHGFKPIISDPGGPLLLVDGDVIAFTAASVSQRPYEDRYGFVYDVAHKPEGEAVVENMLHGLKSLLGSDRMVVVLSDPEDNWRLGVWEGYKGNRKDARRPFLLDYLKQYLRDKHGAFHWPSLEADDTLGILLTAPDGYSEYGSKADRILVGRDKDFLTVPGRYHRLKDITASRKPIIRDSTPWEATRWHMMQTLAGDRVDGYPGCPGIGMERAERIIDDPQLLVRQLGVITRGINKGKACDKWVPEPSRDYWQVIVSNYRKAGATEEDALRTARLAHILHWEDYDADTGSITLWTPSRKLTGAHPTS